jgi:hypothetical protein
MREGQFLFICATSGAIAAAAHGGVVERFIVGATLMTSPPQTAGNASNDLGLLAANVDTATWGYSRTSMTTAIFSISMRSTMVANNPNFYGTSQCLATYVIDGTQPIEVDWNWSSLARSGGWRVMNASGTTVAELSFNAGTFTRIGGTWAQQAVGIDYINLTAGTYTFEAFYQSGLASSASVVNWNLGPIPSPGVLALAGMLGLSRSRRRR